MATVTTAAAVSVGSSNKRDGQFKQKTQDDPLAALAPRKKKAPKQGDVALATAPIVKATPNWPVSKASVPIPESKKLPKLEVDRIVNSEDAAEVLEGDEEDFDYYDNCEEVQKDAIVPDGDEQQKQEQTPLEILKPLFPSISDSVILLVLEDCKCDIQRTADKLAVLAVNIEKADDNDDDYHMVLTTETEDEDEFPPLPRAESTQAASENTQTDAKTVNTPGLNAAITDPLLAAIGQPTSASVSVPSPEQANTFIASASAAWIAVSAAALALLPRTTTADAPAAANNSNESAPASPMSDKKGAVEKEEDEEDWDVVSEADEDGVDTVSVPAKRSMPLNSAEEASSEQFSVVSEVPNPDDLTDDLEIQSISSGNDREDIKISSYSAAAKVGQSNNNAPFSRASKKSKASVTAKFPTSEEVAPIVPATTISDDCVVDPEALYYQKKTEGMNTSRKNPRTPRSRRR